MPGPFYGAGTINFRACVRHPTSGPNVNGFVDSGGLSGIIDGSPGFALETDNYVTAVGRFGFDDAPFGGDVVPLTPVYAGIRIGTPGGVGPGCVAYIYNANFEPAPGVKYTGTVPGAALIRLHAWTSLPDDQIFVVSDQVMRVGKAGAATRMGGLTTTPGVFDQVKARAVAFTTEGTLYVAAQARRIFDNTQVLLVSEEIDWGVPPGQPYAIAPHALDTTMFTYDAVNPWKACAAALCLQLGSRMLKCTVLKYVISLSQWTTFLVDRADGDSARIVTMADGIYGVGSDPAPSTNLLGGQLNYAVAGNNLSYNTSLGGQVFNADQAIGDFYPLASPAATAYADSDEFVRVIPPFWTNFVRSDEIL